MQIGILGGGQLARMLAIAGLPLDIRCRFLDPAADAVAGHAGELVVGAYDDEQALAELVDGVRLVTFEFENVPASAARWLLQHADVAPHPDALEAGQDRISEKQLFRKVGMATVDHRAAANREELREAVQEIGAPCLVKTRRLGYDGKGQQLLPPGQDLLQRADVVCARLLQPGTGGLVVERFLAFERELSVLAARGRDGEIVTWPVVENEHRHGILHRTRAPAPDLPGHLDTEARQFAAALLEELDYTGVLAVELFEHGGRLLANEMAPRVHNSGHWTIEGAACSQFENHLRAVTGLPLGSTAMNGCATMINIVGARPDMAAVLALPGVHLHDYGKAARPGRKLGHVTCLAEARAEADVLAGRVEALLPDHG
jgi:5-(carboxyamino)imidazole ribonucleotide synthase